MTIQGSVGDTELESRLALLTARVSMLDDVQVKLKRLNNALGSLAVCDKSRQMLLIRSAMKYLDTFTEVPMGVKPLLVTIGNELASLREGVLANAVCPKDLVLLSGVRAANALTSMAAQVQVNIGKLQNRLQAEGYTDPAERIILKNKEYREKIPSFGKNEFVISRAPVTFTFQQKGGHSSVGYLDQNAVQALGFKTDNLGGYTIIHDQLVVGIQPSALTDDGKPRRVKESAIKFTKGKPTKIIKTRDTSYLDVANQLKKQLEHKANQPYSFVSEVAVGLNGGHWFWLLPTRDLNRLSKAFPGGHVKIAKWGFAF